MQADNDLTYSYQKPSPSKLAERALITVERTQKLDLLVHLLSNLRQSLVICGPMGIGKSTLLQALQNTGNDRWHFCQLSGASSLSFESILQQLGRSLNLPGSGLQLDIDALRDGCDRRQVILIIDDAGDLVPGLIGELATFAESLNGLRLVFTMTYDEFHIKSNIDTVLDEFHVIELPPLNRKQCREYLQNLSAHPNMPLTFDGINDTIVDDLYHETHGIPGRILAELPKLNHYQSRHSKKWMLWLGATVVTAGAGLAAYSWLMPSTATLPVTVQNAQLVSPPPSVTGTATPAATASISSLPSPLPLSTATLPTAVVPTGIPVEAISPSPAATASAATAKPTPTLAATGMATLKPESPRPTAVSGAAATLSPTPLPVITASPQPSPPATPAATVIPKPSNTAEAVNAAEKKPGTENPGLAVSDQDWIMAQPANNFTLQVMTLSNKDSVRRFMKKYAEYGESLRHYTVHNGEQEKFILIYGSFESIAEAKRYKEIMPGEFKQALEKRFRIVQKESHR